MSIENIHKLTCSLYVKSEKVMRKTRQNDTQRCNSEITYRKNFRENHKVTLL